MGTLNDTLTQQLRRIRAQKEISIESIAEQLGMSPDSYTKIESGETPMIMNGMEDIAKALDVSIPELLSMPSTIIAPVSTSAENSPAHSSANGSTHSNTMYVGVSNEVLERLFKRIDELENEVKAFRKQQ